MRYSIHLNRAYKTLSTLIADLGDPDITISSTEQGLKMGIHTKTADYYYLITGVLLTPICNIRGKHRLHSLEKYGKYVIRINLSSLMGYNYKHPTRSILIELKTDYKNPVYPYM
jgi:hypothetical protein